MIKYIIGIFVLLFVGFAGGNIVWTSVEISIAYTLLDMIENGPKPPGGTPRGT
jgi:hypothetical protein